MVASKWWKDKKKSLSIGEYVLEGNKTISWRKKRGTDITKVFDI